MTPDEFEASFECPSWAGVMWCFWRVMQAAMDGGKTGHGEDIDIAAAKNARKVEVRRSEERSDELGIRQLRS